jgi:hypothetical protein
METREKTKSREAKSDLRRNKETPEYSCVDPGQAPLVFDYLKNFHEKLKPAVFIHLRLCLQCREAAATILKINRYLEPKSGDYLHAQLALEDLLESPFVRIGEYVSKLCEEDEMADYLASRVGAQ